MNSITWVAVLVLWVASALQGVSLPRSEGRRMALIIGINSYEHFPGLVEAEPDAWRLERVLREDAGFNVTTVADPASAVDLRAKIDNFVGSLRPHDTVVIHYAGHGIQSNGRNYLVPPDAPAHEGRLLQMGIPVDALLAAIQRTTPALTLLMLDACRNNPLAGGVPGLASMETSSIGPNTWIEFAAEPNKTAEDGAFMRHLLSEIRKPGLSLGDIFQNVRRTLGATSQGGQSTRSVINVTFNFYFLPDAILAENPMAVLERAAGNQPTGEAGQTKAVEAVIRSGQSLAASSVLQGLSLQGAQMDEGQMAEARLSGSNLSGAWLRRANLSSASLAMAILNGAQADEAVLEGAGFSFADAEGARFPGARAADSRWFAVRAPTAMFTGANLQGAGFMFANLRGANFDGARLDGAVFIGSDLTGASFNGAILDNTDFTGSILDGVRLTPGQLQQACETRRSATERIGITVIEVIPNSRFDGGLEYDRFLEDVYYYRLETLGLPICRTRAIKDESWFPVWQSPSGELVRSDAGLSFSKKFLDQAGRRAAVRNRVKSHFEWLWKTLEGR